MSEGPIFCSCDVCTEKYHFIQQGWECPKCGLINAPFMSFCLCSTMKHTCSASTKNSYAGNVDLSKQIEKLEEVCQRIDPSDGEKESDT